MPHKKKLIDPNYQREAEKYSNPIPSREFILDIINKKNKPLSKEDIFKILGIIDDAQQEGMRRRLRAMENEGQLVFTKRKCYALPEKLDLLKGTIIGHRDGYGFLQVAKDQDDWFIPNNQMYKVMHGDYVLAQSSISERKNRKEVRIVRVLDRGKKHIVGRFFLEDNIGYVVPDDRRFHQDIVIASEDRMHAKMGQVVVVEIKWLANSNKPIGKIIEVLGDNMAKGIEVETAIRNYDIPHLWPTAVTEQLSDLQEVVSEEAKKNRIDLRDLPLLTIDGEDARDFDDAVFCRKKIRGGWTLWVAIADVSYYVRPETALDMEARDRGNSVYFPNRVIPMLPEILSNGLCSLNPQVDRLCLVCEMDISATGKMTKYKFYEAVMNSVARLTYTKVWNILEKDKDLCARYPSIVPSLQELYELFKRLSNTRQKRGSIDFDTIETKFIFNSEGKIDRIEPVKRNDAHKIIEECMILANIAAADFMQKAEQPTLYRVHAAPGQEKLTSFRKLLQEKGLSLEGGAKPSPIDYANLMVKIQQHPDKELLQTMLLRSLSQAVYSAENIGHFGLALKEYAHFTSPIRRYPDLILHRGIKSLLAKQQTNTQISTPTGGYHYPTKEIIILGEHCSMAERRADDATRDVADWLKCEYMQDRVGQKFTAKIVSVTGFGFFARLNDLSIDGLVHISSLSNDYYKLNNAGQCLIGENNGVAYCINDQVEVMVDSVNLDQRAINFALISTARKPRRIGKTAKDAQNKKAIKPKKRTEKKSKNKTPRKQTSNKK